MFGRIRIVYPAVGLMMLTALGMTACSSASAGGGSTASSGDKNGSFTMAISPWIGYGPWYIAQKQGFFAKEGVKVNLVNFTEDAPLLAALASGKVNGSNLSTNDLLSAAATGHRYKVVMLEDESITADAVLAGNGITSLQQLRGKTVAYEYGTTSDVLIHHALASAGIPFSAVKAENVPAAEAGSALIAGRVDVAVTYEPYISAALKAGGGKDHILYSAGQAPGLISDTLSVNPAFVQQHPKTIAALLRAWQDALNYYNANKSSGQSIIATGVGAPVSSLTTAFNGLHFYSLADSKTQLSGPYATTSLRYVAAAMLEAKSLTTSPANMAQLVDSTFVNAAG
jgi:NitT/TauT family transport system substrate-binding protein